MSGSGGEGDPNVRRNPDGSITFLRSGTYRISTGPFRAQLEMPLVVISAEMVAGQPADLEARVLAELRGERAGCACQPVFLWPGSSIVTGYAQVCAEHADEAGSR